MYLGYFSSDIRFLLRNSELFVLAANFIITYFEGRRILGKGKFVCEIFTLLNCFPFGRVVAMAAKCQGLWRNCMSRPRKHYGDLCLAS